MDAVKNKIMTYFLVCKGRSNDDDVGGQGAPSFRRYGWELVSTPAISLKKSWGGYRRTTPVNSASRKKYKVPRPPGRG